MSDEVKPVETTPAATEAPVETTPAPVAAETPAAPAAEETPAKVEETPAEPAAPAEEAKEAKVVPKEITPITAGILSFKGPSAFPKNLLGHQKAYFWFGDEAVPTKNLGSFLQNSKAEGAHAAAAWSAETGKGLFYYAKNEKDKEHPTGVIALADVTDISKVANTEFLFKAHGQKYSFIANSHKEQEGWLKALKAEVEAATGKKEEITSSEGYKKTLESLKPAVVAASVAGAAGTAASAVNPSKTEERETRATNGTTKSKSRSVSRGKGGSIFDRITGKKEEPATEGEPAAAAPATETAEAAKDAPAETAEAAAPVDAAAEEPKKEEVKAEEPKKVEEPKTTRRGSRFGDFLKKIEGKPTVLEKKPAGTKDVAPPVPPKDTEAPKAEDKEEEAATAAVAAAPLPVVATEEVKKEEKETTPAAKPEKKNFFERFIPKEPKAKAPATAPVAKEAEPAKTEETPTIEAPATTEATTEATPAAETTETPAVNGEAKKETLAAEQKEKRRSSFFSGDIAASLKKIGQRAEKAVEPKKEVKAETNGNHAKAEEPVADKPADDKPADETPAVVTTPAPAAAPASKKEKEHQDNPLTKLGRRLSTAFRNTGKDHSKKETPAAKGPETAEPAEAKAEAEEPAKEEETKPAEESKPAETEKPVNSIGDVVPDAVNVGSAPPATATVSATA